MNKANLLIKIGELVREKKIEGISDLRDESDKSGMRMVIELKRGEVPEVVLNNLYKQTQMQDTFGMNMVALVDGQPRLLNLKQMLDAFLRHRREVVTRRTVFELRKARERGHILEGLAVALSNVDEIIALIKAAPTPADAKQRADGAHLALAAGGGNAGARRCRRLAPGRAGAGIRPVRPGLPPVRRPGPGDPGTAPAAPDRPGAGQDRRRIQGGDGRTSPTCSTSWPSRSASPRSSSDELTAIKAQFGDKRRSEIVAHAQDFEHGRPDHAARTWW